MVLFQIDKLTKTYGDKIIFDDLSFGINSEDKIGVIGINGAGKSTLLKIVAQLENGDTQEVMKSSNLRVEYLAQDPELDPDNTVMEQIFSGDSPLVQLVGAYEAAAEALSKNPDNTVLQEKLLTLNTAMDQQDAWGLESEAKKILTKLNIWDFDKKVGELSGGMKKRIAIAGVLIRPADILILDEPTNHIDNDTIEFLETMIKNSKSAVLMVTHDRYFLDRAMNTMVELKEGKLHKYTGNYSKYLEIKAQREQDQNAIEQKKKRLYKSELEWIRKGVEARRTKQKARKDRFAQLEEEIQTKQETELKINTAQTRLGKKIIQAENLSKAYGDKLLFTDFSYTLQMTDRIGIIGDNGAGKTTLLNILAGKIQPDKGEVTIGETVKLGYYLQDNEEMQGETKVLDYIKEVAEYVTTADGNKITASQMLENFLFTPKAQHTQIGKLSGGEGRRLYLLKLLMASPNVLFLDEPTNDLDIETLSILEDYIQGFAGPVVTVSHDRFFLDKICNKIFKVGDGEIQYFMGNYEDYLDQKEEQQTEIAPKESAAPRPKQERSSKKLSFNQQRELEALPQEIESIEKKLGEIELKLKNSQSNFVLLQELIDAKEALEIEMLDKMEKLEEYEKL